MTENLESQAVQDNRALIVFEGGLSLDMTKVVHLYLDLLRNRSEQTDRSDYGMQIIEHVIFDLFGQEVQDQFRGEVERAQEVVDPENLVVPLEDVRPHGH